MVNIRDAVGSEGKYLKAADLQGRDWPLTIAGIQQEDVSGQGEPEMKWVVYFRGGQKGLVLNVTNATTIADQLGDETNAWMGRQVTLFPTQTDFQGKQVACIRIRLQQPQQNGQAPGGQPMGAGPTPSQQGYVNPDNPNSYPDPGPDNPNNYPNPTNVSPNPNQGAPNPLDDEIPF